MVTTVKKNLVLLLVDNLRFDTFGEENRARARVLCPNIVGLIEDGFVSKLVSNGHATKFAMPSLFSLVYPLDNGGYNDVVSNAEKTFAEVLQEAGYRTFMYQGDDNDGPVSGGERGFNEVEAIYDMRLLLQNYLEEVLKYEAGLWDKGEYDDTEITRFLLDNFKPLLVHMANSDHRVRRAGLPSRLSVLSSHWAAKFRAEVELLDKSPLTIARKILSTPAHFYYLTLGRCQPGGMAYLANRIVFRVVGDIQAKLFRAGVFPFRMLTCRRSPLAKELLFSLLNKIRRNEPGPWMAYGHLMDLHDRRLINRPLRVARKMAWYPKWRRLRQDGDNVMRFLYDAALHEFDKDLGRLIDALKAKGAYDNTVFLITGDHGCEMHDAKRRGNNEVFGFRSHPEHIEVPLICGPMDKKPHDAGLHDLMSVPATVLDIAQAGTHPSFKGVSIFEQGRDYVVTENAGRGNADLQRKDLYFTLTEQSRKMMALIRKDQLFVTRLYNTHDDSYELNNIVDDPDENGMIHQLLDYLFDARGEILSLRGVQRDRVVVGRLSNE